MDMGGEGEGKERGVHAGEFLLISGMKGWARGVSKIYSGSLWMPLAQHIAAVILSS